MVGKQPGSHSDGVFITAVAHEGLSVVVNGKRGALAVLDASGKVIASGPLVAREAEAVVINRHKESLVSEGLLRVEIRPLPFIPIAETYGQQALPRTRGQASARRG